MATPFEELCHQGAAADALLAAGNAEDAIPAYASLIERMESEKQLNRFVLAKSVLGLLLAHIRQDEMDSAQRIWSGHQGVGAVSAATLHQGIQSLADGKVSPHDGRVFAMVSGLIQSQTGGDSRNAADTVNACMGAACEDAFAQEPDLVVPIIRNWKRYLEEIFIGPVPVEMRANLEQFEGRLDEPVRPGKVSFPAPGRWAVDWPGGEKGGGTVPPNGAERSDRSAPAAVVQCPKCGQTMPNPKLLAIHARRCG